MKLINYFSAPIYKFEIIDSTNKFAKELCAENPQNGTIIISEEQTNGRGRFGNTWESSKGNGLYYSIIFKKSSSELRYETLTLFISLSITKLLEYYSISSYIKWPNDILINKQKVCGILSEVITNNFGEFIVAGIGINIYHGKNDFPEELKNKATSLILNTTLKINKTLFTNDLTQYLHEYYNHFLRNDFENFLLEYTTRSFLLNRKINLTFNGNQISGIVDGFDRFGHLILRTLDDKLVFVNSGEVSLDNVYENSGKFY